MTPAARKFITLKNKIRRGSSPAATLIFFLEKFLHHLSFQERKDFFSQKSAGDSVRKKRITPLPPIIAFALLTIFYLPAAAEEEKKPPPQVNCPEKAPAETKTPQDAYILARAYDKGDCGFARDKKAAQKWYLKAAKHGSMLAQYALGEKYFTGNDGKPDYLKAKQWYLAAAQQGHGLSQLRLGTMYAEAHFTGEEPDEAEAEKWFLKAAEQNAGDAQFRLGTFYRSFKNPPELGKAEVWLTKAAEGGHRSAMFDLARIIKDKDPAQSLIWMKKAAELDLLSAQTALIGIYATGDGAPKDPAQSLVWMLKVAEKTTASPFWINKAGDTLFDKKDYAQAEKFYARTAAKGDSHALARLGRIYLEGLGIAADRAKALQYLDKAAAGGDTEAQALLKGQQDDKPPER